MKVKLKVHSKEPNTRKHSTMRNYYYIIKMSLINIYIFKCGYFVLTDIPYTFKNLQKMKRKKCVSLLSALSRERILSTIGKT